MKARLDKLRQVLRKENFDAALFAILDKDDSGEGPGPRWLTGYSGSTASVFVTLKQAWLITDSRYAEQVKKEVKGCKIIISKKPALRALEDLKEATQKNMRIAVESARLTVAQKKQLSSFLPQAVLIDTEQLLEDLMVCKDASELASIKKAVAISDEAFGRILNFLKPGLTEKEVAAELEYQMKMLGAAKESFPTIVASGWRSALPHGLASEKKIKKGDFVTFDFGAKYNGYPSDITRTIVMGKASARQKKIYNIVARAQLAGIKKVKNGVSGRDVDAVARKIITRAGYGKYFGHGTGHGLSLEVHARPSVSPRSTEVLKSNMVITVEPGIYIPGWGGVRIEDDVIVRPQGGTVLNKADKKLLEL